MLNMAFVTGAVVGAIVLAALVFVPLVRHLALVGATVGIVAAYTHGGTVELVAYARTFEAQVTAEPTFAVGFASGVFAMMVILLYGRSLMSGYRNTSA